MSRAPYAFAGLGSAVTAALFLALGAAAQPKDPVVPHFQIATWSTPPIAGPDGRYYESQHGAYVLDILTGKTTEITGSTQTEVR